MIRKPLSNFWCIKVQCRKTIRIEVQITVFRAMLKWLSCAHGILPLCLLFFFPPISFQFPPFLSTGLTRLWRIWSEGSLTNMSVLGMLHLTSFYFSKSSVAWWGAISDVAESVVRQIFRQMWTMAGDTDTNIFYAGAKARWHDLQLPVIWWL